MAILTPEMTKPINIHNAMTSSKSNDLSNHEIVTLAVFLLGGDKKRIDTEDVAVKTNELAPGRFSWRKYREQINIDAVRKRLWDACTQKKGGYLFGNERDGWGLTPAGLIFANEKHHLLAEANLTRTPLNTREKNWMRNERERLLLSDAYEKFSSGRAEEITQQDAESFFRVDAYVLGAARTEKVSRALNCFGNDEELGPLIRVLEARLSQGR